MTRRIVSYSIGLFCLLGVLVVAWWGFTQRTSPGPLHPSHANVSQLRGNQGCTACHGEGAIAPSHAGTDSLANACLVCHELISNQVAARRGIHGTLDAAAFNRCETCHKEHLGDTLPLVPEAAFRAVGIVDQDLYDHAHIKTADHPWSLHGKHDQLTCAECHPSADAKSISKGEHRFLGRTQVCTECHDDVHKGELGTNCAECHGQERPFKESPLFKHPDTFPLRFGHANRVCSDCHVTPKVFTGLSLECASCHTDDYDQTKSPPHALAGLSKNCTECHTSTTWQGTTFKHPNSFALQGAHSALKCASCHAQGEKQNQVRAHAKKASCTACHATPHEPRFVDAAVAKLPPASDSCLACHHATDALWSDAMPRLTPELHAATGFPLSKPHNTQVCGQCHVGVEPGHIKSIDATLWRVRFPGRSQETCEKCHQDPHAGQFVATASKGACTACHETTRFFPTTFGVSEHASCGFELTGSHKAVACALCHKEENGVRRFVGVSHACADCHEDVHKGAFDKDGRPITINGVTGCARCHSTDAFQKVTWSAADHLTWTGEALTGKHAQATCNQCHRRDAQPGRPLTPIAAAPKACASCHEDPHAGQFRVGATTDCAKCHQSTEQFKTIRFDHDKDSQFPLDADHRTLACAACHKPQSVGTLSIVRYKPLGTKCADCHDSRGTQPTRPNAGGASP